MSKIKEVFPDIIVHTRGKMENNKMVIEAKKEGSGQKEARWFDLIKLALFTKCDGEYKYDVGYFIDIPKNIPKCFSIDFIKDKELEGIVTNSNVWIVKVNPVKNKL